MTYCEWLPQSAYWSSSAIATSAVIVNRQKTYTSLEASRNEAYKNSAEIIFKKFTVRPKGAVAPSSPESPLDVFYTVLAAGTWRPMFVLFTGLLTLFAVLNVVRQVICCRRSC